jgi:ketosteroid isomerase-like protein
MSARRSLRRDLGLPAELRDTYDVMPEDSTTPGQRQNVEVVRLVYDAYNREGMTGILEYLDADVEWRNPVDSPIAGVFVGHEGVLEFQRLTDEVWEEVHFEPVQITELPDGRVLVLVRFRFRARASEMEAEVPFAHLITVRDGKATVLSMYTSEAAALQAAGLGR